MDKEQITESTPTESHTTKHPVRKFFQAIAAPVLVLLVIYGFFQITGLRLCAVLSGSMEPEIPTYSYCLIDTRVDYDSLKVGDIIVYDRPYDHMQVVHRIVAILDDGVITQGDANPVDDGILLTAGDITGLYLGHVPGIGRITSLIRTPVGITVILAIVVLLLISDARPRKQSKGGNSDTSDSQ